MERHLCTWIIRLNIVKMSIISKAIFRLNAIPIKSTIVFFAEIGTVILQFTWQSRDWKVNTVLRKNKVKGLTLPNFKKYHKVIGIKTV